MHEQYTVERADWTHPVARGVRPAASVAAALTAPMSSTAVFVMLTVAAVW